MTTSRARVLLIADFTISAWRPFLTPELEAVVAPFDQVQSVLADPTRDCWAVSPELAVVWTRPASALPSFHQGLAGHVWNEEALIKDVDEFAGRILDASDRVRAIFIPSWTLPPYERQLGILRMRPRFGAAYWLHRANARLAERLEHVPNVYVLDAGRWLAKVGEDASNPKLWFLGKMAFGPALLKAAAADLKAAWQAVQGQSRKLIILDLDDTLWGGVVGDVGWERIQLGGHDPVGEAFVAFQQGLRALRRRGIALAIVSKNEESIALEAIDRHPEMVLRRDDFVGWRINWRDKAQNIVELVSELDLGLDAAVFIDDSPLERHRVAEALPQVLVPGWPGDKLLYAKALAELDCFDAVSITGEDQRRTEMYASERRRKELRAGVGTIEAYLESLGVVVKAELLGAENIVRAAQLLNKTNQFNLATRRLTESELRAWHATPGNEVLVFRVSDRFGDYGLTGLASWCLHGARGEIVDFLLSCRVLGRGVEETMLHVIGLRAAQAGAETLQAVYRKTDRNAPCRRFFQQQPALSASPRDDGIVFSASLRQGARQESPFVPASHVRVEAPLPAWMPA